MSDNAVSLTLHAVNSHPTRLHKMHTIQVSVKHWAGYIVNDETDLVKRLKSTATLHKVDTSTNVW